MRDRRASPRNQSGDPEEDARGGGMIGRDVREGQVRVLQRLPQRSVAPRKEVCVDLCTERSTRGRRAVSLPPGNRPDVKDCVNLG